MLSKIKKHLNPATAIALLALIFAITGVSFAATGGGNGAGNKNNNSSLVASASKSKGAKGPRGARGPTGPAGKNGTNGLNGTPGAQGPAGSTGPTGPEGKQGKEGKEGKGKLGPEGEQGEQGAEGSPWPGGGILAKGATETGAWSVTVQPSEEEERMYVSFSFPVRLGEALAAGHGLYVTLEQQKGENGAKAPEQCKGTAAAPTAAEGYFCIYEGAFTGKATRVPELQNIFRTEGVGNEAEGVGVSGSIAYVPYPEGEIESHPRALYGSWAVTAP